MSERRDQRRERRIERRGERPESRGTAGIILIALGLGFFLMQRLQGASEAPLFLLLGAGFVVVYLYRRVYGLLIPGCILIGMGLGELVDNRFGIVDGMQLGLGIGFISIFIVAWLVEQKNRWWTLIPGTIIVLFGLGQTRWLMRGLFDYWPLILIALGVILLLGGLKGRKDTEGSDYPPTGPISG